VALRIAARWHGASSFSLVRQLTTSISIEAERQRSVIAKSRSCKIAAALGSSFFPAWCIFLVTLPEQDLLPVSGTSFARDASRGTLADATDDISIGAGRCSLRLLARVGHSSLAAGGKHIYGLAEFGCRTLRVVRVGI
jgi:hypothetical protein